MDHSSNDKGPLGPGLVRTSSSDLPEVHRDGRGRDVTRSTGALVIRKRSFEPLEDDKAKLRHWTDKLLLGCSPVWGPQKLGHLGVTQGEMDGDVIIIRHAASVSQVEQKRKKIFLTG